MRPASCGTSESRSWRGDQVFHLGWIFTASTPCSAALDIVAPAIAASSRSAMVISPTWPRMHSTCLAFPARSWTARAPLICFASALERH